VITGKQIIEQIKSGMHLDVNATRLYGTVYKVTVSIGEDKTVLSICQPGCNEPMQFDSLDEVAAFLSQVGIKQFRVTI